MRHAVAPSILVLALALAGCAKQGHSDVDLAFAATPTATQAPSTTAGAEEVAVAFTVDNRGARESLATGWRVTLSGGGTVSGTIPALAAGGSYPVDVDIGPVAPGAHQVTVTIDPTDAVREDIEGNNVAVVPVSVAATGLDLAIPDPLMLDPAAPKPTGPATVHFAIHETSPSGTGATDVAWRLLDRGAIIGSGVVASIPAGAIVSESFDLVGTPGATTGEHSLVVELDPDDAIVETDETDNVSAPLEYQILPSASG